MTNTVSNVQNARCQFFYNGTSTPLAGGSVYMYVPGTTTPKNTWSDYLGTVLNANPIILDSNGQAEIYGNGSYRQIVKDVNSNTIWDQVTTVGAGSASSTTSLPYGTTTGSANTYSINTTPAFTALTTGMNIICTFNVANTGATTLNPNSIGAITIVDQFGNALIANEIAANTTYLLFYNGTNFILQYATLLPFVGDSGSGGAQGLVPAPPSGSAAANKFLGAGGSFAALPTATSSTLGVVEPDNSTININGSGVISAAKQGFTLGTPTAFNSATSYNITGLPAGIKQINMNLQGITFSGTADPLIQIGDATGGLKTSGYIGSGGNFAGGGNVITAYTTGLGIKQGASTPTALTGSITFNLLDSTNFIWVGIVTLSSSSTSEIYVSSTQITLSGVLDRITFTTVGGTTTWTAGKINISYI